MITLQPITEYNFEDVIDLKALEDFVAPNAYSLAEAYTSLKQMVDDGTPHLAEMPFAIFHNETAVGFTMIAFEDGEDVQSDSEIYWMSRFMIDENHQGNGYGKAAMAELINFIKTKPHSREVEYFYTAVVPSNHIATKLYERMGFVKTGSQLGGEDVMRLVL